MTARKYSSWSDEEYAILWANRHLRDIEIQHLLPGRTLFAINRQRTDTGALFTGKVPHGRPLIPKPEPAYQPVDFGEGFGAHTHRIRSGTPIRITAPNQQIRREAST